MGKLVTAPLGEASASVLSHHCGVMVRGVGSAAARELSGLAWRMRGSRERQGRESWRLWRWQKARQEGTRLLAQWQASGRRAIPYLLSLLLVLHGRTEDVSPVCLPGLDL